MKITYIDQKTGDPVECVCYRAFTYAGEEFVVHRRPDLHGMWVVSHLASAHCVGGRFACETRESAKQWALSVVEKHGEAKVRKAVKRATEGSKAT